MQLAHTRIAFLACATGALGGGWAAAAFAAYGSGPNWLADKKNIRRLIDERIMAPPTGRRVTDHIFYSSMLENVAYIDLGPHAVLMDTGFDHQAEKHLANFEKLGCDLGKVRGVLCSHSHVDHTAGVKTVRDRLGVPIVAHPRAIEPITTGDRLRTAATIPEVDGWVFDFPACPVDRTVDQGDAILIGDERIEVIHLPGHTPCSLGYLWRGHLFTGDAVFGGGMIGWANARWHSNFHDHTQTMQRLLADPPAAKRFYATHGPDLPYSDQVPRACIETLTPRLARQDDPCNLTPRISVRQPNETTHTLRL